MDSMTEFESEQPPVLKPAAPPPPTSTLLARLLNIFAIPGLVFEEVRVSRHKWSNWLLPMLLSCMVLAAWGCVILATPAMQTKIAKMREQQTEVMRDAVAKGKQTQAEADQFLKAVDLVTQPEVMRALAVGGGVAIGVLRLAWWAFLLWVLARAFLRVRILFSKAMEAAGLASMIAILSTVVLCVLTIETKGAERGLVVSDLPSADTGPLVVVMLNLLRFWLLAVLSTGLARLTGAPWFRAALLVFIAWLIGDLIGLLIGAGAAMG
jgi:hypothetical protein